MEGMDLISVDAHDETTAVRNAVRDEDVAAPPGDREAVERCREDGGTGALTVSGAEVSVAGAEVSGAAGFRTLGLRKAA
jgi:hypothetical protein